MRLNFAATTLALATPLLSAGANAQTSADPASGHTLAQKLCSNCHLVGRGDAEPTRPGTPSFEAIGNRDGQTPERIAGAIIVPHPEMPQVPLTIKEIRDIVAYIGSLKK